MQLVLMTVSCRMNPTETKVQKRKETKKIQRDIKRHVRQILPFVVFLVMFHGDATTKKKHLNIMIFNLIYKYYVGTFYILIRHGM